MNLDEWAKREMKRRIAEESDAAAEKILPAERFPDEDLTSASVPVHERGSRSPAIQGLIAGNCCGWPRMPTGEETVEALRAAEPDQRQRSILAMIATQMPVLEMMRAALEGACTLRDFARAVGAVSRTARPKWRVMNRWARGTESERSRPRG